MPWLPTSGISGFTARRRVIASRRKSVQCHPARWYMRIASVLSLLVTSHKRFHPSCRPRPRPPPVARAHARAAVGRHQRDELGVAVDLVDQRAADRAAVDLRREAVEQRSVVDHVVVRHQSNGSERRSRSCRRPILDLGG